MLQTWIKHHAGHRSSLGSPDGLWTCRDTIFGVVQELLANINTLDQLLITFSDTASRGLRDQEDIVVDFSSENQVIELRKKREEVEMSRLAAKLWMDWRHGFIGSHIELGRYGLDSLRKFCRITTEIPKTQ